MVTIPAAVGSISAWILLNLLGLTTNSWDQWQLVFSFTLGVIVLDFIRWMRR